MIIVIIYLHLNYVSIYEKMTAKIGRKKREPKNHIIKQSLLCLKKKTEFGYDGETRPFLYINSLFPTKLQKSEIKLSIIYLNDSKFLSL
jgi:hypothetical protein